MVYKSEEGGNFLSHSPLSQNGQIIDSEMASETSVFLPQDNNSENSSSSSGNDLILGDSIHRAVRRGSSNLSRNLGILVISDALPVDTEKDGNTVTIESSLVSSSQIKRNDSKDFKQNDEEAQALRPQIVGEKCDKESEIKQGRSGYCRNYVGILLTLISGLVFTIGGVIVKYLKNYHPFTLSIFRFQGILLPGLFMVLYANYVQKVSVFEPLWPLSQKRKAKRVLGLTLRCVFGTTALLFHFYALQRLDVADALVIGSGQPVFVTLAAYFFLGEACGIFPVFTAILTIVGVGVISRPPILTGQETFDSNALIGAGFSVSSMLTSTIVFVIVRYLKDVHVSLLTFVLGCWGSVQSIICSLIIGEFTLPQTSEHWLLVFALAGITLIGQVAMTKGLQCEQAGSVAVVRTCDCLFAFLLQFVLLNTIPDLYSLIGASIIIFCVVLTTFRKWVTTYPNAHPVRKRFWFVLV